MGDDENIVETIKEEVTEAAKAVVAEVKSIAHEVADAIAEGKAELCGDDAPPAPPHDGAEATPPAASKDSGER
jgi:hypothetical protein